MSADRAPRRPGQAPRRPDPALTRLADAILVPPFPGRTAPSWVLAALARGLAGVTLFGSNVAGPEQLAALTKRAATSPGSTTGPAAPTPAMPHWAPSATRR
jgi:2-keto-3-deoxy-6-phosphogluconate aldolase